MARPANRPVWGGRVWIIVSGRDSTLPPHCNFITEPAVGPFRANQVIGFHSTSSDDDGTIIRYEWNFGDGTSGDAPDTAKIYRTPGSYTVTHSVIDDDGARMSCVTAAPGIVITP